MDRARIFVDETFSVPVAPAGVWPLLADPELIATCIPNATLKPTNHAGIYEGTVGVKLGPLGSTFKGEATVESRAEDMEGRVVSRGADRLGTRVTVTLTYRATAAPEGPGTSVAISGTIDVDGPLAKFAQLGGQTLAKSTLRDFAANLEKRLLVQDG